MINNTYDETLQKVILDYAEILIDHEKKINNLQAHLDEYNKNKEVTDNELKYKLNKAKYEQTVIKGYPGINFTHQDTAVISTMPVRSYVYLPTQEKEKSTNRLLSIVLDLEDNEDKQYQVQLSATIIQEIRMLLKKTPKIKDNYKRQLLLLLHQAIKKNYTKILFTQGQVDVFKEIADLIFKNKITREEYYKYDEMMYDIGLNVFPDWE